MKRIFALAVIFSASMAAADERILSYHADIVINRDAMMDVTETIRVRAEGQQIRRGIFRDYYTHYEDHLGNNVVVDYEPLSLLRNDRIENFQFENRNRGIRTYFGSADRFIEPGEHTYVYRYRAGRMLGYFDDKDELWWNVTGTEWAFPIDEATAKIRFEFEVTPGDVELNAWQGAYGSTEVAQASMAGNEIMFSASRPLGLRENLSILARWPKGLVYEPDNLQKARWLLSDNANLLTALLGLAAMFAYYLPVWKKYGKDPEPGTVFTRYEPPDGYSPASLRYIEKMSYDDKMMTSAVISLAVKGYLRIIDDDGEHSLIRLDTGKEALATGEEALYAALFDEGDTVKLDDKYHKRIGTARSKHRQSLINDYRGRYFRSNGAFNLLPFVIGMATVILSVSFGPSVLSVATWIIMLLTFVTFAVLMKRPTGLGRKIMDETAGFREYLEIAEKDELNLRNPPEKTPELFEKFLPFALAMDVDQQWSERFARIFESIRGPNNEAWQPTWYSGHYNSRNFSMTTSNLTSDLGSSISSSVSPPGSASGGGGGGFSGGGGGGGGGGGW